VRLALLALVGATAVTVPAGPAAAGESSTRSAVEKAVRAKVGTTVGRSVVVNPMRSAPEWLFGAVVLTVPAGSEREPESWLFLARAGKDGWAVGLEHTGTFDHRLPGSHRIGVPPTRRRRADRTANATEPSRVLGPDHSDTDWSRRAASVTWERYDKTARGH
jgi:hypothetical protein